MLLLILFAALIVCAGLFNGQMDFIKENQLDKESWKNKWQLSQHGIPVHPLFNPWYYFGIQKPKYVERFPFSSTIFVFFTDKWHFYKWCMFLCIEFLISISISFKGEYLNWWQVIICIIILKALRGFGFSITHAKNMH